MNDQTSKFADEFFSAVRGYIARSLDPLRARFEALEKRAPERGADGKDGRDASPEAIAEAVDKAIERIPRPKDGIDGAPGQRGIDGRDGADGEHGRDAALIEPLASIDPERSYARGTWAKHQRGLWLSRSVTNGMTGWDCIVAGVADIVVVSDGLRTVTVTAQLSDGNTSTAEFTLPTIVYRGAWAAAGEYQAGDVVSWDGSMWHCEEKSTTERPGTTAWRMCVKRGRDGKDGVRGAKGERGGEGRAGKDLTQLNFNGSRS